MRKRLTLESNGALIVKNLGLDMSIKNKSKMHRYLN